MNEIIGGAVLGFDDFIKDMDRLVKSDFYYNPEEIMEDLITKAEAGTDDYVGCVLLEEYTKANKNIAFSFHTLKEDEMMFIAYVGYEEM
jgi:hypothetical protein